jgi:hypothetical protein
MIYCVLRGMATCSGALVLAGSAFGGAINPKPGRWHGETSPRGGKDDNALFVVEGHEVRGEKLAEHWVAIVTPTTFKCNEAFLETTATHLSIKNGRSSYSGKGVDTAGGRPTGVSGTLNWTGVFTSPTTVKGTVRFRTSVTPVFERQQYKFTLEPKPCDTGTIKWTGKVGRTLQ